MYVPTFFLADSTKKMNYLPPITHISADIAKVAFVDLMQLTPIGMLCSSLIINNWNAMEYNT